MGLCAHCAGRGEAPVVVGGQLQVRACPVCTTYVVPFAAHAHRRPGTDEVCGYLGVPCNKCGAV